jgi:hypothetical protein
LLQGEIPLTIYIEATTFRRLACLIGTCREPSGGQDSTQKTFKHEIRTTPSGGSEGLAEQKERSKSMPLIQLLEVLVVVGVLLWLVNRFIPMQRSIKSILNGVVVIAVVLWLLNVFGLFHSLSRIHVGRG